MIAFRLFARPIVGAFIANDETVAYGVEFLRGRCFALPFMMIGYHVVNYMNAVGRGKVSFLLAIIRHLILLSDKNSNSVGVFSALALLLFGQRCAASSPSVQLCQNEKSIPHLLLFLSESSMILNIPLLLLMNHLFGLDGLIWARLVTDVLNAAIASLLYRRLGVGEG